MFSKEEPPESHPVDRGERLPAPVKANAQKQERGSSVGQRAREAAQLREALGTEMIRGSQQRGFHPASRWREHLPTASAELSPLLSQAAERGGEFPLAERAMFMACEFWAAVAGRTLPKYLGADGIGTLRYMTIVFLAMGAPLSARSIARAVACMNSASTPEAHHACQIALQSRLLAAKEPVDALLTALVRMLQAGQETETTWLGAADKLLFVR
jgi:hypothetical protein